LQHLRKPPNRHKLTAATVARLQPAARRAYVVWDTHLRGLAVVVQPSGHKAWVAVYQFMRRSRWYTIGNADVISLAKARKLAAHVLNEVFDGKDPAAEKRAARSADTFAELSERYLNEYAKRKNKSWKQAEKLVNRNLLPRWGKLPAATITKADVKAMMVWCDSASVANQTLAAASAIFTWAIKEDVGNIKLNPCSHVARNATQSRERVLKDAELPRFWSAFDNAGVVGIALKLILLTGQRPGEVCAIRTEHIADGWWAMPGKPEPYLRWPGTKNGRTHRVWLPTEAQELLEDLGSVGRVFDCRRDALSTAMRAICAELDLAHATPHDLRRTHGTTITALKFGRDAMNRIQNHKEGGIADVYDIHDYAAENKQIMEAVASRIMLLVTGKGGDNVVTAKFGA
jgi:integrase